MNIRPPIINNGYGTGKIMLRLSLVRFLKPIDYLIVGGFMYYLNTSRSVTCKDTTRSGVFYM